MTTEKKTTEFEVKWQAFGGKDDTRRWPTRERAEQWAEMCGIRNRCTITEVPVAFAGIKAEIEAAAAARDTTIAFIKAKLKERSPKIRWSVTTGRGSSWGWITVTAGSKFQLDGVMMDTARAELGRLLGLDGPAHGQGVDIAASTAHRREFCERVAGLTPSKIAEAYWD